MTDLGERNGDNRINSCVHNYERPTDSAERIYTGPSINTKTGVSPTFPKGNTPFPTIVADKAKFSQLENNLEKEI